MGSSQAMEAAIVAATTATDTYGIPEPTVSAGFVNLHDDDHREGRLPGFQPGFFPACYTGASPEWKATADELEQIWHTDKPPGKDLRHTLLKDNAGSTVWRLVISK